MMVVTYKSILIEEICIFHSILYITVIFTKYSYLVLQNNKLLKTLLLGNNRFEDKGARLFKEAISDNTTLETLDLSWNHFKTKGAIMLADAIKVGKDSVWLNTSSPPMAMRRNEEQLNERKVFASANRK